MSQEDDKHWSAKLINGAKVAGLVAALFAGTYVIGRLSNCCPVDGDAYDQKIATLSKTNPKLVKYQELRRIKLALSNPKAITIGPDGRLYVSGSKSIAAYDRLNGTRLASFKLAASPTCLSAAPGSIYAGFRDHVEVYDSAGKLKSRWTSLGPNAVVTSISAGKNEIWAADAGNRVIVKYSPAGQVLALVGKKDAAKRAPGIIVPSPHLDVVAAGSGGVWAANPGRHELELYAADGSLTRAWGKTSFGIDGFSGCCNPTDFAILPNGKFVTSEKGLVRVKTYLADGKFEGVVAGTESFKAEVVGLDLAVDAQGHIFVLDPATGSVRVYILKGKAN